MKKNTYLCLNCKNGDYSYRIALPVIICFVFLSFALTDLSVLNGKNLINNSQNHIQEYGLYSNIHDDNDEGIKLIELIYQMIDDDFERADSFIRNFTTLNAQRELMDAYYYDCDEPNGCLGIQLFVYDEGSDVGDFIERQIIPQGNDTYLVTNKYQYGSYKVILKLIKIDGRYNIDDIKHQE